MSKKFIIGQKFENGLTIIDGPIDVPGARNKKYLAKCGKCGDETWKWSGTIKKLKHGCKKCYDESMKRKDQFPAVIKAFSSLRSNAKQRGINVEININQFYAIASQNCKWCGEPPSIKTGSKDWQSSVLLNGIDRADNRRGYTIENSVSCCYNCNRAKSDLPLDLWFYWLSNIVNKNYDLLR